MDDFDIYYVHGFAAEAEAVDWGVLIAEWQGPVQVLITGYSGHAAQVAKLLREAAAAVEKDAHLSVPTD